MTESSRRTLKAAAFGLFLILSPFAFSANIVVPSMEMITHGVSSAGLFTLQTYGSMTLQVEGGYKFGGSIAFGLLNNTNLEGLGTVPVTATMNFLSASMTIRDLFSAPLNISYFVGQNDIFCSGDGFDQFGAAPIMTRYRGFLYFPSTNITQSPIYDGIYQIQGTGAKVELTPVAGTFGVDAYFYEDTHNPPFTALGNYSGDLRFLLNYPTLKLEAFVGATAASSSRYGLYRGGLLFYAADRNVEFLAQVGIPRWDPGTDATLSVNLFYLLVEPRLHMGLFSIVPTFFWHPEYYMQAAYPSEIGTFDVNLNMYAGDPSKTDFQGGAEANFRFQYAAGTFALKVSPWIGFSTPGVLWTLKVNAKLWPFSLADMLDGFVGVRAEF
jgi:hypothetical protein